MANLLPQPGPNLLPEQPAQTFAAFYQDDALDPCHGDYAPIMARFDPEITPTLTPGALLEQANGCGPIPQVYLCCSNRQNQTKIYCIHLPSKFTGALDGRTTTWDGMPFAFLGEAIQGHVTMVTLPDTVFSTVTGRVNSTDYFVTHLDELTAHGMPPPAIDDQDATAITTRMIMYLPARYVPLFLSPAGYTIRQAWEVLYPALANANDVVTCAPLLKWLKIASTSVSAVNRRANILSPSVAALELVVPLADEALISHRLRLQKQVLPGMYQPAETLERAITQMAVAVTQNTNENRIAWEEKAARQAEEKLPSDRFKVTINILQEYLQTPDEGNLPPLWHKFANCTKRQDFNILSEMLQAYSRSGDAFSSCAPIASPKLVQDLINFVFVSESTDDIRTGLQPFIIADASAEHRQANLELARMYGMLNAGDHSIQLTDLEALQSKEVQSIPVSYFELERNLGMFGNLLGTVAGTNHILTVRYRDFWVLLSQSYRHKLQQIIDTKRYIKPVHILRSIQLMCYTWFSQQ
jgi:hypothetical protein